MVPLTAPPKMEPATPVAVVTAAILLGLAGLVAAPASEPASASASRHVTSGCAAAVADCSTRGPGSVRLMAGEPRTGLCTG